MSTYKKPNVVHLDAESKALADLAAARAKMPTKEWLSKLIAETIQAERAKKGAGR